MHHFILKNYTLASMNIIKFLALIRNYRDTITHYRLSVRENKFSLKIAVTYNRRQFNHLVILMIDGV